MYLPSELKKDGQPDSNLLKTEHPENKSSGSSHSYPKLITPRFKFAYLIFVTWENTH